MRELLVPTDEELSANLHKKLDMAATGACDPSTVAGTDRSGRLPNHQASSTFSERSHLKGPTVRVAKQDT